MLLVFDNKTDNYFKRSGPMFRCGPIRITEHSINHWLPCPAASCVPNAIGTWGGNSVKFSQMTAAPQFQRVVNHLLEELDSLAFLQHRPDVAEAAVIDGTFDDDGE